ncbi:RDD family protein [compost metagenome]
MEHSITERLAESDYAGFWKRVLINLVDFLILALPVYFINGWAVSAAERYQSGIPLWIQWVLISLFNIVLVVKYGGTPGRLILRTKIVNEQGKYPSLKQAVIRYSFLLVNTLLAVIVAAGDGTLSKLPEAYANWAPLASDLTGFLALIIIIDCLFIVFSMRNRALHDMMAGTYVVNQSALLDEGYGAGKDYV